jgi:hypothetical protein
VVLSQQRGAPLVKRRTQPSRRGGDAPSAVDADASSGRRGGLPAGAALPFERPYRLVDGEVAPVGGVSGKSALVLLEPGSVAAKDVAAAWDANPASVAVLTNNHRDGDHALEGVEGCIKAALRARVLDTASAHGYPPDLLPHFPHPGDVGSSVGVRLGLALLAREAYANLQLVSDTAVVRISNSEMKRARKASASAIAMKSGSYAADGSAVVTTADSLTAALPEELADTIDVYGRALNASQRLALAAAHTHRVTSIRGPPGTGKTSTIAAICQSFVDRADVRRVLVLAPSNAATKRILESLVSRGFEDAALVVSR